MAQEAGAKVIATASTGNAASSLATLAASTSLEAVVFVPRNAPRAKMIQIAIHGAQIIKLDCDYDHAFDLCQEACAKFGWYNRNTAVNPFTGEGKKSAALEIARDFGRAPDSVICPVGDGCIIGGLYKGFSDLFGLGLIDKMPRLYGIQAKGASPLVSAFMMDGEPVILSETDTIADSISVGYPRDSAKALRAVKSTNGAMIAVTEEEILSAQKILARDGGIFAEPAAAASYAGLLALVESGQIDKDEKVVVLITGHGLKDIDAAAHNVSGDIETISPEIDAVEWKIKKLFK
jgi:threonine synthase